MLSNCEKRLEIERGLALARREGWKYDLFLPRLEEQKRVRAVLAQSRELLKQMQTD